MRHPIGSLTSHSEPVIGASSVRVIADGLCDSFQRRSAGMDVRAGSRWRPRHRDGVVQVCSPHCSTPTRCRPPNSLPHTPNGWEIESAFDELKTHQRGSKMVLRSKSPALVQQEIWGHLCCHYAIRTLMFEAADQAAVDPDRVSFVAALRNARRSISAARDFPPASTDHGW